jgi:uncharacterized protein with PIN domain
MAHRFIADAMLGRLAKWLRLLGYDTLYDASWSDAQLVRLARAEDRILLTRDTALARRRGVRVLLVASEELTAQLAQLCRELGLGAMAPFSRCPVCNEPLVAVPKDHAWGQVPPYIFVTQEEFRLCPSCDRFFWRGTHWQHIQELLASLDRPEN